MQEGAAKRLSGLLAQGNRILCSRQHRKKTVFVPASAQALAFHTLFSRLFLPQQVQGQMAQDSKVGVGMSLAHAAGTFIHGHVQHPVEAVLDPPMTAARRQHLAGFARPPMAVQQSPAIETGRWPLATVCATRSASGRCSADRRCWRLPSGTLGRLIVQPG